MQQATLLFLMEGERILLAMKKRGFGEGHWNGVGGKPEPGESIEDAAIRECQEEIHVTPLSIKQAGKLKFHFLGDKNDWDQEVTVYTCHTWKGNPEETEEMAPRWFNFSEIPYDEMWSDDKIWLPEVLKGKTVTAEFTFSSDQKIIKHSIKSA